MNVKKKYSSPYINMEAFYRFRVESLSECLSLIINELDEDWELLDHCI